MLAFNLWSVTEMQETEASLNNTGAMLSKGFAYLFLALEN